MLSPPGKLRRACAACTCRTAPAQSRPCRATRCALALAGDFEKQDIERGMWVVDPPRCTPR
jgi:hypothetical protein